MLDTVILQPTRARGPVYDEMMLQHILYSECVCVVCISIAAAQKSGQFIAKETYESNDVNFNLRCLARSVRAPLPKRYSSWPTSLEIIVGNKSLNLTLQIQNTAVFIMIECFSAIYNAFYCYTQLVSIPGKNQKHFAAITIVLRYSRATKNAMSPIWF